MLQEQQKRMVISYLELTKIPPFLEPKQLNPLTHFYENAYQLCENA